MATALAAFFIAAFAREVACGQETIASFPSPQGTNSVLVQGTNGDFYGTSFSGGAGGNGTVFKITSAGVLTTLASFTVGNAGIQPCDGLVLGSDGNFYGTASHGGTKGLGTVFKMTPQGAMTTLVSFTGPTPSHDGGTPYAGLVQGTNGNFYGTTYWGGNPGVGGGNGLGTVFSITPAGAKTILVQFGGTNGGHPTGRLVVGQDGNFYGTTYWGGNTALNGGNGYGSVFRMTPTGVLTNLVKFAGNNGAHPYAALVQAGDGNFYGTCYWGGDLSLNGGNGFGTVFKMTPDGTLTTLTNFNGANGSHPTASLIMGNDGNLYGTTLWGGNLRLNSGNGYGTVFQMTPAGALTTLVSFTAENGAYPFGGVIQDSSNNLYGTTSEGGTVNSGNVYLLAPLSSLSIVQQPDDLSVSLGADAQFQVTAYSADPPGYQWQFNGMDILGANDPLLTLASVQLSNAGVYTVIVTNLSGSLTSRVASLEVDPAFTKITTGALVTSLGTGTGCAWADYDLDGFNDLIVTSAFDPNSNTGQKNQLFHNNGDGTFSLAATASVGLDAKDWRGCSWADIDNDGFPDLYVASTSDNGFAAENELFHNNGDGTFTKMSAGTVGPIVPVGGSSQGPVWADIDRDGFIDLYIARFGTGWLFRNSSAGTFTQVISGAVAVNQANQGSYGAMWADYDNNGWPDLLVTAKDDALQKQTNFLYNNAGAGQFTRITTGPAATDNEYSAGCAWGDIDNDGYPDLFVANGLEYPETCSLYHNNGDGSFTKLTNAAVGSIVSDRGYFTQCAWGDYDNDGYLDLIVTVLQTSAVNYLYHNNGDGTFTRVTTGSLVHDRGASIGCTWADIDNDGFLDLFIARGTHVLPTANLLYRNNGNSNGWLKFRLVGTVSNRSAIGAKVRVHATIGGKTFWQLREINTGDGYCAGPLEAHFGLGDATNVDTVRIEWPSGTVQEFQNVSPRQTLTITEPPLLQATVTNGVPRFTLKGGRFLQYDIQASADLSDPFGWATIGTLTPTNLTGTIDLNSLPLPAGDLFHVPVVDDPFGQLGRRYYRAMLHPGTNQLAAISSTYQASVGKCLNYDVTSCEECLRTFFLYRAVGSPAEAEEAADTAISLGSQVAGDYQVMLEYYYDTP